MAEMPPMPGRPGERIPLLRKSTPDHYATKALPSAELIAEQYEKHLEMLERAMRELNSSEVRHQVDKLGFLSSHLEAQPNAWKHLEKGRFGKTAREQLRREYIDRYVMLRGGGPVDYGGADGNMLMQHEEKVESEFSDQAVRHGFIQKVYGILCFQLVFTAVIGAIAMNYFDGAGPGVTWACLVISTVVLLVTVCAFSCKPALQRNFPTNYVILGLMTAAMSVLVGISSAQYTAESVIIAAGMTAVVVLGLTMFACQTQFDVTGFGPYLLCALLVMCSLSFCFLIGALLGLADSPAFQTLRLIYAAAGALLMSFYIVYDTQLIVGGKHRKHKFSVDDYCMAAINLYLDIINLFLYLLELFGNRK